jgi:hypothetical protein
VGLFISNLLANISRAPAIRQAQRNALIDERIRYYSLIDQDPNATEEDRRLARESTAQLHLLRDQPETHRRLALFGSFLPRLAGGIASAYGYVPPQHIPSEAQLAGERPAAGQPSARAPLSTLAGQPSPAPARSAAGRFSPAATAWAEYARLPETAEQKRQREMERAVETYRREGDVKIEETKKLYGLWAQQAKDMGLTGDIATYYGHTGKFPPGYAETFKPAVGTRIPVTIDGKPATVREAMGEDGKLHYYRASGQEVPADKVEFAAPKPEAKGPLETLTQAYIDRNNPNLPPERRQAVDAYIKKQTAGQTREEESDDEAKAIAQGIEEGNLPPAPTGLSRAAVWPKVEKILAKDKYNLKEAQNDLYATRRLISTLRGQPQVRLLQATEFTMETIDTIDNPRAPGQDLLGQLRGLVPRTRFPVINKAAMGMAKNGVFGKNAADVAHQLDSQIQETQMELGIVYRSGNSPTDDTMSRVSDVFASDWDDQSLRSAMRLTRANLGRRLNSVKVIAAQLSGQQLPAESAQPEQKPPVAGERRVHPNGGLYEWDGKNWNLVKKPQ